MLTLPLDLLSRLSLSPFQKGFIVGIFIASLLILGLDYTIALYEDHFPPDLYTDVVQEEAPPRVLKYGLVEEITAANFLIGIAEWELGARADRIEELNERVCELEGMLEIVRGSAA